MPTAERPRPRRSPEPGADAAPPSGPEDAFRREVHELIARAKTSRAAVRLARRAGLRARYAGVKRFATRRASTFVVTGRMGMGHGTCGRGAYKVWRYAPARRVV